MAALPRRIAQPLLALLAATAGSALPLPLPLALSPQPVQAGPAAAQRQAPRGLNPEQQRVANASLQAVRADMDGFIARYLNLVTTVRDAGGKVIRPGTSDLAAAMARGPLLISPDDAKELFGDYAADQRSRSRYSDAVHKASGLIIDALWPRALAQPSPMSRNTVLLVGGGVASGKTTAMRSNAAVQALMAQVALVRESTLANPTRAAAHIAQARSAGRPVEVLYVFAPIEVAVQRLVDRGMRQGRAVPATAVARSHWQSQQTVLDLAARYRQDRGVRFHVLLSGTGQPPDLQPIAVLQQRRWSADARFVDQDSFHRYVQQLVHAELERRRLDAAPEDPSPDLRQKLNSQP
ncbi:MAG: zeta toxin family protein [Cyanobacteriota bacterium]|nr:zeta toxin family protein [Cyanobacteriota bacterium]